MNTFNSVMRGLFIGLVCAAVLVGLVWSLGGCTTTKTVVIEEKGASGPHRTARVIEDMLERSVKIYATCLDGTTTGSGVILESSGGEARLASAAHVLDGECLFTARDSDGLVYLLHDVTLDEPHDLGTATFFTVKDLAPLDIRKPTLGEPAIVIGWPYDKLKRTTWLTVTRGNIAADYEWRYRVTAPINFGNSGGPVFNTRGQLICIVSSGMFAFGNPVDGMYYCAKADLIPSAPSPEPSPETDPGSTE